MTQHVPTLGGVQRGTPRRAPPRPVFVFNLPKWQLFLRDLLIMQVGFALIGLYIAIVRSAGVDHLVPWGLVEHGVADLLSIKIGTAYLLVSVVAVLLVLVIREPFGWGSVANFFLMTFLWVDLVEQVMPDLSGGQVSEILWVLLAVPIGCAGTAIYVSVGAGAGPRDNVMFAIARLLGANVGVARVALEGALVVGGLILGQSAGWATLAHVAVAGPAIWLAFRLLKVEPHQVFWGRAGSSASGPTS